MRAERARAKSIVVLEQALSGTIGRSGQGTLSAPHSVDRSTDFEWSYVDVAGASLYCEDMKQGLSSIHGCFA